MNDENYDVPTFLRKLADDIEQHRAIADVKISRDPDRRERFESLGLVFQKGIYSRLVGTIESIVINAERDIPPTQWIKEK